MLPDSLVSVNYKEVTMALKSRLRGSDGRATETDGAGAYITVPEAADLLRMSEISIRRFLTQKKLARFKAGGRTLLRRDQVLGMVREV
jgi:excisionase family DNA binding protein